jgi:hypothetical protein
MGNRATVAWLRVQRQQREDAKSKLGHRKCPQHDSEAHSHENADSSHAWQRQRKKMLEKGWCCHQVDHLARNYNLKVFSYLASLERSPQRLQNHQGCDKHRACIAYNSSVSPNYQTRHVSENCDCDFISTPYEDLIKVIRRGRIPLISIREGEDTAATPTLKVYPRTREVSYVAISHVWADGLGNPNANALPRCQVEFIRAQLASLRKYTGVSRAHTVILFRYCTVLSS